MQLKRKSITEKQWSVNRKMFQGTPTCDDKKLIKVVQGTTRRQFVTGASSLVFV